MATRAKLFVTENRFETEPDGKPMFEVQKITNSVDYTIGQTLGRTEVAELLRLNMVDVTIAPRKDQ